MAVNTELGWAKPNDTTANTEQANEDNRCLVLDS